MFDLKILYAEDNEVLRKQYSKYLNHIFKNILEAKDGKEALELYKIHKPDIMLLDLNMPYICGLELAKIVRQSDNDTKIIVLTASSEKEKLLQAIPLNLVDYLIKPIKIHQLTEILNKTSLQILSNNKNKLTEYININSCFTYNKKSKKIVDCEVEITLTKNEIKLVELFIINRDNIIPTDEIFNSVWDDLDYSMTKLRSLINRLNQKLSKKIIISQYGLGYKMIS